ncbi:MAG: YlbF family regulator [Acutalibacteraceae bacterium]
MEILEITRKLGAAIQADETYKKFAEAKKTNDEDKELQDLIGEFNLIRMNVSKAMSDSEKDEEKIEKYNKELQECYKKVMANESMIAYNEAKTNLDAIINKVNTLIAMCIDGADPETVEIPDASCTGSCSTCGGCH